MFGAEHTPGGSVFEPEHTPGSHVCGATHEGSRVIKAARLFAGFGFHRLLSSHDVYFPIVAATPTRYGPEKYRIISERKKCLFSALNSLFAMKQSSFILKSGVFYNEKNLPTP